MLLPWCEELDENERFLGNIVEIAGGDVNNVGGTLGNGHSDEGESGQGTKERRELHDEERVKGWWNKPESVCLDLNGVDHWQPTETWHLIRGRAPPAHDPI